MTYEEYEKKVIELFLITGFHDIKNKIGRAHV